MKKSVILLAALSGAGSGYAAEMPQTARELNCTNCHAIDNKVYGPAWMDVSRRYRDARDNPETFDALVKKVSLGGKGNWGGLPMPANDPLGKRREKVEELVKFILALSGPR